MNKKSAFVWAADLCVYVAGGAMYSVAVLLFLSANEISPGGLTGIATVLNYLFMLPVGTVMFLLNIPILIIGFMKLGGVFILKTTLATVIISVILDISEGLLPAVKIDPILAAVFGGLLMGLGISMFMLRGATTGGVDIIAKLINRRFPHITVGRLMLLADVFVVAISTFAYKNIESALYSVIALYASSRVIDMMLYGADKGKIVYIITEESAEMSREIMSLVKRGVTVLEVTGAYTGRRLKMLMCTVRRNEVSAVCRLAREFDKKAFIVIAEAGEILGEGFKSTV
ncbi:MAG: YitT family protein [Acutalibacteraceae bacterium]